MKYLFVIQGEGRGHFTQALSLKEMLERNGHTVTAVMVGSSAKRRLPDFFTSKIAVDIIQFQSPNFLPTPKGKQSPLLVSILFNLLLLPVYIQSLITIFKTINKTKPDIVVNFYELLCGVTYGLFNPEPPMINVAHQYYFLTPNFEYTGVNEKQFKLLNFYTRMTAMNSSKTLALSFRNEVCNSDLNISIVPPLLRREVLNKKSSKGDYIHGYMINSGYAKDLAEWSEVNSQQDLHFFWDKKNVDSKLMLTPSLTMHALSDSLFLDYMAGCKAYATTGGFESVCEAMYLQKPLMMVPIHIEQECNVIDALRNGVGVTDEEFDLDLLLEFVPTYKAKNQFRYWVNAAEQRFLAELTSLDLYKEKNVLVAI